LRNVHTDTHSDWLGDTRSAGLLPVRREYMRGAEQWHVRRWLQPGSAGSLLGHGQLCDLHACDWNRDADADPDGPDRHTDRDIRSKRLLPMRRQYMHGA
jgi:hypothetical protein